MSEAMGSRKHLIAIIEDEAIVLVGYQMLFESWGYDVACASCGDGVVKALKDKGGMRPDAILADYRLREGCTGVVAIQKVLDAFGEGIPAILVTGDTAPSRLKEAAASGYPILHKPVNGRQLRDALAKAIAGNKDAAKVG